MQRFAKTEIRLSDTFDFPRKSFRLFHFTYQATWLALALEALFWRVSRDNRGDSSTRDEFQPMRLINCLSRHVHQIPSDRIIETGKKNGCFKEFEERRVLCAFASMGKYPAAVLWVRRSNECVGAETRADTCLGYRWSDLPASGRLA